MTFIKIIIFAITVAILVAFLTLFKNNANLLDEPGLKKRLQIFLTTNTAATASDHELKELRTPVFDMTAVELYRDVLSAAIDLGWVVFAQDGEKKHTNFVVYSPVFLFKDKIYVQVKSISETQSSLYIHAKSAKGHADFASNSGHIQALIKKLNI